MTQEYLAEFKRLTESTWSRRVINPALYGFQVQRGTRWNPGLSDVEIAKYEKALDVSFPHDLRAFLKAMNGTDLPTVNVYGSCGEPHRMSVGVYSFPRDLKIVQALIKDVLQKREEITIGLKDQDFDLSPEARLVPFYGHRYVVCTPNLDQSTVLSIYVPSVDAIVYGNSLREYLEREFLGT